ncbi:MAG TPA: amidase [Pseudomonadales bacterium]
MSDLVFRSATELARAIADGELSSQQLLEAYLERVNRHNPALNAVVVQVRERALERARAADAARARGESWGPLHGVPMTIKESYNLTGTPTTWGNPDWRTNIAAEDAVAVRKLEAAGAVVFGKTNVPLALADFQSYNDVYGTTNNPYDHSRVPGGSSGGSAAALAAGLTGLEIGSDIGGSIRNPSHYCGVFGHKPTWGLLWMRGHSGPGDIRAMPDISVIGPLARSADDLDTAVRILAGPDDIMARGYRLALPELARESLEGLRVAVWADDELCPVSGAVRERVERVAGLLRDAGASIDPDARPDFTAEHTHEVYQHLLQATMATRMPEQEYRSLQRHVAELDPDDVSPTARVLRAQVSTFRDWSASNEARHKLRWRWHEFFQRYDVLLTPIMPTSAFPHDHRRFGERTIRVDDREYPYFQQVFWAGLTGVAYLPSTVIPTGLDEQGLPIGVQIAGPEYGDLITIGVARLLERTGCRFEPPPAYR